MFGVPRSLGHAGQLSQCLGCAINNKEAGLVQSHLLVIPASLNSDEASKHVFQECIHTLLHEDVLKILHRPDVLSKALSGSKRVNLCFQSSYLLMNGKARKPKTQFAGSVPPPPTRGFAIQPPYVDMYFQIWEDPKSDLQSEPKNP